MFYFPNFLLGPETKNSKYNFKLCHAVSGCKGSLMYLLSGQIVQDRYWSLSRKLTHIARASTWVSVISQNPPIQNFIRPGVNP